MKRIKEIRIQNFKAFQQEEVFDINGKNVLVYGNNGSGKSSFYWALYTLLQSSTKTDVDVKKYFKTYLESDKLSHQTLKNVHMPDAEDAFVKLTSIDSDTGIEVPYTISQNTINTNNDSDTIIQELNIASDFINYKLLQNFYKGSHKQEVNLWPVFERDIFPYLTEGTRNWLENVIKDITRDVPRTLKGRVISKVVKQRYVNELNDLNDKIQGLLNEIQTNANEFIKDHFFEGKDVIRVVMSFNKKFKFDNVRFDLWGENKDGYRNDQLHIKLSIEIPAEDPALPWKKIERVQSFLNEAQLTRIAIGIRIGALRTRPINEAKFKILVLDDMLISLDLSNRMDVVRIILNKDKKENLVFFDSYQKIILTHDKGFFNLIRKNTDEEEWVYYNFTKDESVNSAPSVKVDLTPLQKAVKYFNEDEFENSGNELRKEAEAVLTSFIDPDMKNLKKEYSSLTDKIEQARNIVIKHQLQKFKQLYKPNLDTETLAKITSNFNLDPTLSAAQKGKLNSIRNSVLTFLIEINSGNNNSIKLLEDTKEILDRILNSASHHSENPLYRSELKDAIAKIGELREVLLLPA